MTTSVSGPASRGLRWARRNSRAMHAPRLAAALGALVFVAALLAAAPRPAAPRPVAEPTSSNTFKATVQHWAMVEREMPSYGWWDSAYDARVGRDPADSPTDRFRSYFQFDIARLAGKLIKKANVTFAEKWRYSCTPEPVYLWATAAIGPTTTWTTAPALTGTPIGSVMTPADAAHCTEYNLVEFDAKTLISQLAAAGASTVTLALASNEAATSNGAKVFDRQLYIDVEFNSMPSAPPQIRTGDAAGCSPTADAYVNTPTPGFTFRVADADPGQLVRSTVEWRPAGGGTSTTQTTEDSSDGKELTVPVAAPLAAGRYEWRARSFNVYEAGNDIGPWSAWCSFVVDTTPPAARPGISVDSGPGFLEDRPVTATLTTGGDPDTVQLQYFLNGVPGPRLPAAGGTVTVQLAPMAGTNTLSLRAYDRAGNAIDATPYAFQAARRPDPVASWTMVDWLGDNVLYEDLYGVPAPLHGNAAFGDGYFATSGLSMDGSTDSWAETDSSIVDTSTSFTIMAWVRLTDTGDYRTAISLPAPHYTTAMLRYNYGSLRWDFVMRASDADGAAETVAASIGEAQVGIWTHLAGVYDADAGQMRLYVNGKLQGTAAYATPWAGTGRVAFGTANYYGFRPGRWVGDLDEVTIYGFAASARKIGEVLPVGHWGSVGHWPLDDGAGNSAKDTTTQDHTAAVASGATWVAGRQGPGALHLPGKAGCGTAGHAYTAGPVVDPDASFTVAAWVRLERTDSWYSAVSQDGRYDSAFSLEYSGYPQGWAFTMQPVDGPNNDPSVSARSPNPAQPGVWTHLAGVYDRPAGQLRLYINGRLAATAAYAGTRVADGPLQIGRNKNDGFWCSFWPGDVDDVQTEAKALSAADIAGWMNSTELHGPRGTWPLDEAAGSLGYDAEPGNGNTLALVGPVTHVPGKSGNALHLAGDPDGPLGPQPPATAYAAGPVVRTDSSFSVAAWVRPSSLTGTATVISQDGRHDSGFELRYDGGTKRWTFLMSRVDGTGDDPVATVSSPVTPQVGQWVHLVGTYDADKGELRIYVNGALGGVTAYKETGNADQVLILGRGKVNDNATNLWLGDIDEVHIVSKPLAPEDIRPLLFMTPMGPGAWWRLDEGSGTNLADSSGNGHMLGLQGNAAWSPVGRCGAAVRLSNANGWAFAPQAVLNTAAGYSVAAWVRLETTGTNQTFLSQRGTQASAFRLRYDGASNKWAFTVTTADTASASSVTVSSAAPAQANVWTHLVGVRDGGQIRLYVDGQLSASAAAPAVWSATGQFTVGYGLAGGTPEGANAAIDEVRALGRAATATDIEGMYATCDDVGPPPLPLDLSRVRLRSMAANMCLSESGGFGGNLYQIPNCANAYPVMTLDMQDTDRWQISVDRLFSGPACVGVAGGSTADGAAVVDSSACDPVDSRLFRLEPVTTPLRGYRLHPRHTDKCLGLTSAAENAQLVQQACSPTAAGQIFGVDARAPRTVFRNDAAYPISDNATVESPILSYNLYGDAPHMLRVAVTIQHTFIGDLVVSLIGPTGQAYVLHDRTGGSADDIVAQYTVDASGQPSSGLWKLRIQDAATGDVGNLTGWSLSFDYGAPVPPEPGQPSVTASSLAACALPGFGLWGINATVTLSSTVGVASVDAYYTESDGTSGFQPMAGNGTVLTADLPAESFFTSGSATWYARVTMLTGNTITTSPRSHAAPC